MRLKPCRNPKCSEKIDVESRKQFHNEACRMRFYRSKHATPSTALKPLVIHQCLNCGKSFSTNLPQKKFHNTSCRVSFYQQMKRLQEKENAQPTE